MCHQKFCEKSGKITLLDIKKGTSISSAAAFGANIYDMSGMFLFEFPNKNVAVQIFLKEWRWKTRKISLHWWSPTTDCLPASQKIHVSGRIPLHLWSQKIFIEIGNMCSGWVATEEKTELKNHLKWATIKIGGDSWNCPSNVSIERGGYKYHFFPYWSSRKLD